MLYRDSPLENEVNASSLHGSWSWRTHMPCPPLLCGASPRLHSLLVLMEKVLRPQYWAPKCLAVETSFPEPLSMLELQLLQATFPRADIKPSVWGFFCGKESRNYLAVFWKCGKLPHRWKNITAVRSFWIVPSCLCLIKSPFFFLSLSLSILQILYWEVVKACWMPSVSTGH